MLLCVVLTGINEQHIWSYYLVVAFICDFDFDQPNQRRHAERKCTCTKKIKHLIYDVSKFYTTI